ncbi:hypothetical protein P5V15_008036 [Pogonomyrmex californicus]
MLAFAIRGVVLLGVLGWYSATIWKMIDGYFKDQFRVYLQEEYRKYPRIKADVESAKANVDKGPVSSALPSIESSHPSHGVAETYASNAVCPAADIADACRRAIASNGRPQEAVAGGTSEIVAALGAGGPTDKNAFPANAAQESREPPSGDTRDKERRPGAINRDGDREEDAIGGSVLPSPASPARRPEKPRRRLDKRGSSSRVAKEVSREISGERPRKRRVNTLVLTDADFAAARTEEDDEDDFSEFEEDEGDRGVSKEGILVSELPFKPRADIGDLDRVTAEEFCPLTLEDETSCGETITWP